MARKHTLVECNPHWVTWSGKEGDPPDAIYFDCPEGHEGCKRVIPFTPALDGTPRPVRQSNGAHWARKGDTFETLTLSPSIRGIPTYESREAALAAGAKAEYLADSMFCRVHIFVRDGKIVFCSDSK